MSLTPISFKTPIVLSPCHAHPSFGKYFSLGLPVYFIVQVTIHIRYDDFKSLDDFPALFSCLDVGKSYVGAFAAILFHLLVVFGFMSLVLLNLDVVLGSDLFLDFVLVAVQFGLALSLL